MPKLLRYYMIFILEPLFTKPCSKYFSFPSNSHPSLDPWNYTTTLDVLISLMEAQMRAAAGHALEVCKVRCDGCVCT